MSQNCTHLRINNGFAGQIWLTDEQWDTYRRVPPVRYVRHKLVTSNNSDSIVQCFSCGKTDSIKNLQVAHLIGHSAGHKTSGQYMESHIFVLNVSIMTPK